MNSRYKKYEMKQTLHSCLKKKKERKKEKGKEKRQLNEQKEIVNEQYTRRHI